MKNTFILDNVYVYQWETDRVPLHGVVLISHGMVETAERYERLALKLNSEGYHVLAHDHYGHGRTASSIENIGILQKVDFERMVDFIQTMVSHVRSEYKDLPVFILGHSMGSFILQRYMERYNQMEGVKGIILSGTAGKTPGVKLNQFIVHGLSVLFGSKKRAPLLDRVNFGPFNKKFRPNRTQYDWLSRDEKEVDRYIESPFCGQIVSYGFFECLLDGLGKIHQESEMNKIRKELPIYLFSGDQDPVGKEGKSVRWLAETYQKLGIRDVSMKLYQGGRHEMLNEINRDEVMKDLLLWLEVKNKKE